MTFQASSLQDIRPSFQEGDKKYPDQNVYPEQDILRNLAQLVKLIVKNYGNQRCKCSTC